MNPPQHDLADCPIFASLSPAERHELQSRLRVESFAADCNILNESRQTRGLWIIKRGQCQVVKATPDGASHPLAELGPGAIFGEMSFFQPAPNSATVKTVTDVEVWTLTPDQYAEMEEVAPRVAYKIVRAISAVLAERLRRMDDWISRALAHECQERHQEWSEFRAKLYTNWDF